LSISKAHKEKDMKDARDYSRQLREIKESCPMINDVIKLIKWSYAKSEYIGYGDQNEALSTLEDIRQINCELREISKELLENVEYLEEQVYLLNNE